MHRCNGEYVEMDKREIEMDGLNLLSHQLFANQWVNAVNFNLPTIICWG